MSIESANAFIERMKNDEEFAKKIMAETTAESRMELARGEGFYFTAEEIGQSSDELMDEELDAVVGGVAGHQKQCLPIASGKTWSK